MRLAPVAPRLGRHPLDVTIDERHVDLAAVPLVGRRADRAAAARPASVAEEHLAGRIAVMQEPTGAGRIGLACVGGATSAIVAVGDTAHLYARPLAGQVYFESSADGGPAMILAHNGSTGIQWALILLPGGAPAAAPAGGGAFPARISGPASGGLYPFVEQDHTGLTDKAGGLSGSARNLAETTAAATSAGE